MDRTEKAAVIGALNATLKGAAVVVVTRQVGLTVAESSDLRRKMQAAGARYKVTKNRLARLALKGTKYEGLDGLFTGPTAIAWSSDPVAAAKVSVEFAKSNEKLTIVGGALGDKLLGAEGVKALAALPSLDELRGRLVGLLQAPATKVAGVLQAPAGQLARVLKARAEKQSEAA
ncbi:MAG: 50S ribosomal protein L10 [Caenispirillum bisanense]|nr:50S ribosomal protein L10 [Caenispirillum bisanense]MCA1973521.1 50S ribosomal protein L10 [Caenispirillum sp.]